MSDSFTAMLIVASEIGLGILLIFIVIFIFYIMRKSKDAKTSHQLIEKFKTESPDRKSNLEDYVKNNLNLSEDEAGPLLEDLLAKEKSIYSNVLKIYSGRDRNAIVTLNNDIKALTEAYQSIAASSNANNVTAQEETNASGDELIVLRTDNVRLRDELKTSLESIDRVQKEYQSLYEKNKGDEGDE